MYQDKLWLRGYVIFNNSVLSIAELYQLLTTKKEFPEICHLLNEFDGQFAIVIKNNHSIYFICDRSRTFPLFYSNNLVCDLPHDLDEIKNFTLNKNSVTEMRGNGLVSGRYTLVRELFQVQAGEIVVAENAKIHREFYAHHLYPKPKKVHDFNSYLDKFKEVTLKVTAKYLPLLVNKKIYLPLSGGYDSRFIALILKMMGIKNVTCFTFGRKNREVDISRKVADKLEFDWHYVEYNQQLINGFLDDSYFKAYYKASSSLSSMFYLQEYFAVKELFNKGVLAEPGIVIPGHSGDTISGSHFFSGKLEHIKKHQLTRHMLNTYYNFSYLHKSEKKALENLLQNKLNDYTTLVPGVCPYSLYENWLLKERHSKYIVNSANVFNFFGHQTMMPLWDSLFLEFFKNLPFSFKTRKQFYNKALKNHFFRDWGIDFEDDIQSSGFQYHLQYLKNKFKFMLPDWYIQKLNYNNDWVCYKEATDILTRSIHSDDKNYRKTERTYNGLIIQFYIHKLKEQLKKVDNE